MAQSIREVMTGKPVALPVTASVVDAARAMSEANIGDVVVLESGRVYGILTDRDIVVRALAKGRDPAATKLEQVCSHELTTLAPTDSVDDAVRLMREKSIRRLPVVDSGKLVGIVSIGDLAVERDPRSALGNISSAPPNR